MGSGLADFENHFQQRSETVPKAPSIVKRLIDTGVSLSGYFGDSALTVPVGEISDQAKRLLKVTEESLELAIDKVREGNRLFDICGTVERHVTSNGFSVVREFVGHGIGTQMHEEPQVPNYVDRRGENPMKQSRADFKAGFEGSDIIQDRVPVRKSSEIEIGRAHV